jgi:hypothetical protein
MLLFLLYGLLKALANGIIFRPTYSRLVKLRPQFFSPKNWRWAYKNGDPTQGYKYSQFGMAWRTPFRSGWHLIDLIQLYLVALAYTSSKATPWLIPIPLVNSQFSIVNPPLQALLITIATLTAFTAVWKTKLIETKKPHQG